MSIDLVRPRIALIACAAGLAFPASAAADSYFSLDHLVGDLDVRANHVAWTLADDRGRFHLRGGFAGTAHELPVRPAGSFGGIDLGTDSRGRTVLVYARCPRLEGRPCDVYLYRPGHGERRVASVSRPACSETSPHIDRGSLLFSRKTRRSRDRRRRCSGGVFVKRPGHPLRRAMHNIPTAYDLAGREIAFERDIRAALPDPEGEPFTSEIRLLRIGRHHSRLVQRGQGSVSRGGQQGTFLTRPRLDGGYVYWQRSVAGPGERDDIQRRPLAGGPITSLGRAGRDWVDAGGPGSDNLFSFAVNGPRLFYLFGGVQGSSGFPIGRVEPAPVFG